MPCTWPLMVTSSLAASQYTTRMAALRAKTEVSSTRTGSTGER